MGAAAVSPGPRRAHRGPDYAMGAAEAPAHRRGHCRGCDLRGGCLPRAGQRCRCRAVPGRSRFRRAACSAGRCARARRHQRISSSHCRRRGPAYAAPAGYFPLMPAPTNFDHLARPYRWLEYLTFGPMLERCRFCRIPELTGARRALVLGDGDGRFLARLLAANPALEADVVDQSPAMLRLLQARAAAAGSGSRIRIHQTDALTFQPAEAAYDLVVTHFFLDCFTTGQMRGLVENLSPHLLPGALWI